MYSSYHKALVRYKAPASQEPANLDGDDIPKGPSGVNICVWVAVFVWGKSDMPKQDIQVTSTATVTMHVLSTVNACIYMQSFFLSAMAINV